MSDVLLTDVFSGRPQCLCQNVTFLMHRLARFIGLRCIQIERLVAYGALEYCWIGIHHTAPLGTRTLDGTTVALL